MRAALVGVIAAAVLPPVPQQGWCEDLVVSAAVSLSNAFTELGRDFEREHAGVKVLFNFGASGQLLQQIAHGAPADVFASADEETMDRAQTQQLILPVTRFDFARNRLVLAVPAGTSPPLISSLQDLKRSDVARIALGTPDSVPAGRYARDALELAGLWDTLKPKYIYGQNVRQVLDYVERGEVDAGFVYASDTVVNAKRVRVVTEASLPRPILYPIAVIASSTRQGLAREFAAFVVSDLGHKTLSRYGFSNP
jgi:molybdate transport system substrate-binding protein